MHAISYKTTNKYKKPSVVAKPYEFYLRGPPFCESNVQSCRSHKEVNQFGKLERKKAYAATRVRASGFSLCRENVSHFHETFRGNVERLSPRRSQNRTENSTAAICIDGFTARAFIVTVVVNEVINEDFTIPAATGTLKKKEKKRKKKKIEKNDQSQYH